MRRIKALLTTPFGPLAPLGWLLVAVVAFVILGLAKPKVLGFQFDPFGLDERKIAGLEKRAERAEGAARSESARADGEAAIRASHERETTIIREAAAVQAEADVQARTAPNANDPLPADSAARLHDADRAVCNLRPAACPKPEPAG